jgi:hypothetical protein
MGDLATAIPEALLWQYDALSPVLHHTVTSSFTSLSWHLILHTLNHTLIRTTLHTTLCRYDALTFPGATLGYAWAGQLSILRNTAEHRSLFTVVPNYLPLALKTVPPNPRHPLPSSYAMCILSSCDAMCCLLLLPCPACCVCHVLLRMPSAALLSQGEGEARQSGWEERVLLRETLKAKPRMTILLHMAAQFDYKAQWLTWVPFDNFWHHGKVARPHPRIPVECARHAAGARRPRTPATLVATLAPPSSPLMAASPGHVRSLCPRPFPNFPPLPPFATWCAICGSCGAAPSCPSLALAGRRSSSNLPHMASGSPT